MSSPFTKSEADTLYIYTSSLSGVENVTVYDRTNDIVIWHIRSRDYILETLSVFSFDDVSYNQEVSE